MDYQHLYKEAEKLRISGQPEAAIANYQAALEQAGDHDRAIRQMIGVCYNSLDKPEEALTWFNQALEEASDDERSNILRDRGYAHSLSKHYDQALADYRQALELASVIDQPDGFAATLGFYGRTEIAQGSLQEAITHLRIADAILQQTTNRHIELYNALWLAHALILDKQAETGRTIAERAKALADKYGARDHQRRAQLYLDHADDPEYARNYKQHLKA